MPKKTTTTSKADPCAAFPRERLGQKLPEGTIECLWFPVLDAAGATMSWIARPLPHIEGKPKFLCPIGSGGPPYIPKGVHGAPHGRVVIIGEGPVKALLAKQAGYDAIGINGVWGAAAKNSRDQIALRADLYSALDWRGRKVCICFDADCAINPDVRHAMLRLFFLLSCAGAEVYQLTTWNINQGKGIDDFIVGQCVGGPRKPEDVFSKLLDAAKPFIETIKDTPLDLALVSSELSKVQIPDLLREQLARPLADQLGVRVDEVRKIGKTAAKGGDFIDAEPWPEPVSGEELLKELFNLVHKHIITEDHCKVALALWVVLDYLIDVLDIMLLLAITSPEKRCGKTRLLTLLSKLVRRPFPGVSLSAATVYRIIEKWHPSLLIDEADGILKDSRGHDNVELRSVINSGHTREFAWVPRCVGDNHEVEKFSTWAPKAIALIGRMPDSMFDRSIPIPLKRKAKGEKVAKIRETAPEVFETLCRKIVRFVQDYGAKIAAHKPTLPEGLHDRAEDCWIPLLAIAEVAGGDWPELARKAALSLSHGADNDADTFRIIVLRSVEKAFKAAEENKPEGFLATSEICDALNTDDEAPWANLKNQMTRELLAKNLRRFEVKSEQLTRDHHQVRGFLWEKLEPVCNRYL